MSAAARKRLAAPFAAQPQHAEDVLADLGALTARWDSEDREALLRRIADRAGAGVPLPAAVVLALAEALDER